MRRKQAAGLEGGGGRGSVLAMVDVPNHASSVDHKSGAAGQAREKAENPILPGDLLLHIA